MNWSQLRRRIDSGKTGDKIAVTDPAAVPLGTDEEAGGHRTPPHHIERSAAREAAGRVQRAKEEVRVRDTRLLIIAQIGVLCIVVAVVLLAIAQWPVSSS